MPQDSSSESGSSSVFCGADLEDRFARHAQRALESEQYANETDERLLVDFAEMERFFQAVEIGDKQLVIELIERNPSLLNGQSKNRHNATALHIAAENNFVDVVSFLLEAGADANIANSFGLNALGLCPPGSRAFEIIRDVTELKENGRRDAVLRGGDTFYRF